MDALISEKKCESTQQIGGWRIGIRLSEDQVSLVRGYTDVDIKKWLAGHFVAATIRHALSTYVVPPLFGLVVALGMYFQQFAWPLVLLGGGIMFAAVSSGLLRYSEWIEKRKVEDKFEIVGAKISKAIKGPGFHLGAYFENDAFVPIEVQITEIHTSIGNRIPTVKFTNFPTIKMTAKSGANFADNAIEIEVPKGGTVEGQVKVRLRYGRPGALRYQIQRSFLVILKFDAEGRLSNSTHNALD